MPRAPTLRTFANRRGRVDERECAAIRRWLDEDWEAHDVDADALRLIKRLLDELEGRDR